MPTFTPSPPVAESPSEGELADYKYEDRTLVPVAESQPTCDTPGCGRPIPVGGEGDPEICPKCLKDETSKPVADSPKGEEARTQFIAQRWITSFTLQGGAPSIIEAAVREAWGDAYRLGRDEGLREAREIAVRFLGRRKEAEKIRLALDEALRGSNGR